MSRMDWKRNTKRRDSTEVKLPHLHSNGTESKGSNCSYINNHKKYLKMKGYNLNDVYSLKRNRKHSEHMDSGLTNSYVSTKTQKISHSDLNLPALVNNSSKYRNVTNQKDVWRPNNSRKWSYDDMSYRYFIGRNVHKHNCERKLDHLSDEQLDNSWTRTRIQSLLGGEETYIPKNVYTNLTARF